MAYDTKFRPTHYTDVLGQEAHAHVLREFVRRGKGFGQSYLFAGQHGSGKTTLGRILARALLCENPTDGIPCDECVSCKDILTKGISECFTEFDAATKSGKDNILRVTEEIEYSTFAGKQRVYLFDESHRLSKQALDALLKPLEDEQVGSEDKRLVCIFCTTEPEKMVSTVFSRCAPTFTIKVVKPEVIAKRLAWVCEQESVEYEMEALTAIAAIEESHIRDALKTMESIALLGPVTMENVHRVLQLDTNETLVRILGYLGTDLASAMVCADELTQLMSPTTCYKKLAMVSMLAYKVALGAAKPPPYWKAGLIEKLGEHHGDFLPVFAQCFAGRPGKPTPSMLALDLARLHQTRVGAPAVVAPPAAPPTGPRTPTSSAQTGEEVPPSGTSAAPDGTSEPPGGNVEGVASAASTTTNMVRQTMSYETPTGRYIDRRGVKRKRDPVAKKNSSALDPNLFSSALSHRVRELRDDGNHRGPSGRNQLGGA